MKVCKFSSNLSSSCKIKSVLNSLNTSIGNKSGSISSSGLGNSGNKSSINNSLRLFCSSNNDQFRKLNEIEESFDFKLPPYQPIIIRLDGCSFSTLTKKLNLNLPHDQRFHESMKQVSIALANHFKGTRLIYSFSDEINLLVWNHFPQSQIYSNRIQKLNSIASSIASVTFSNSLLKQLNSNVNGNGSSGFDDNGSHSNSISEVDAYFDSRVFVIPEEEIAEYFNKRYKRCYSNCLTSIISYNDKKKEYGEFKKIESENQIKNNDRDQNDISRYSLYNREKFIQNNLGIKLSQYPEHFRNGIVFYRNQDQSSGWEIDSFQLSITFINNIIKSNK